MHFLEGLARLGEMDYQTHEGCIKGGIWKGGALTVFRLESHIRGAYPASSQVKHPRGKVGSHQALGFGRQRLCIESGTAAKFDCAAQRTFLFEPLSHHAARLPPNLQIHHPVILLRDVRPEFSLVIDHESSPNHVPREPAGDGWVVLRDHWGKGPNVSLNRVPTRRAGKRSRLHLDLYTSDRDAEVERLIALGATRYPWRYRPSSDFVVLEDPDRNLFCVVQRADS